MLVITDLLIVTSVNIMINILMLEPCGKVSPCFLKHFAFVVNKGKLGHLCDLACHQYIMVFVCWREKV